MKYLLIAASIAAPAWAQVASEDFDTANTHLWSVNGQMTATYNAMGGNGGGMISVTGIGNPGGATNLTVDLLIPTQAGHPWQGNFRALGVNTFSFDREFVTGGSPFGDAEHVILADDNGTPNIFNDDAFLAVATGTFLGFGTPGGWTPISVLIPSDEFTIPMGWEAGAQPNNPNNGLDPDGLWNAIITDVDYIAVAVNSPFNFFPVGTHTLNYDNFLLDNAALNVGTPFCDPAANNSTGSPANLFGTMTNPGGSGLHLEVNGGPDGEFGYFIVGTASNDPGNMISDGFLCLDGTGGNAIGRYNVSGTPLTAIGSFDGSGLFQNLVGTSTVGSGFDVPSTLPFPGSPMIMAGETYHFQLWYRDTPAGAGRSNFSNGLSVTF